MFPYQLVAFIDRNPSLGEPVYDGKNGWYPQIALKRRFKPVGINENELIAKIQDYCNSRRPSGVVTKELIKPERMPVKVVEVHPAPELMAFHNDFISFMGDAMVSRYPERDGANYMPHITAEYGGRMVIDADSFTNRTFQITKVVLLKDAETAAGSQDSIAFHEFSLHSRQR